MAAKTVAEDLIAKNMVAIFRYCPYCSRTKRTISEFKLGDKVAIVELDHHENGAAIQDYLASKTGQRTVPNVFIKKEHIGGDSDVQAANRSGQLAKLLA
ncbi:Glutaredoxin [Tilletia horrida]|uniref:Glutaredoxin n=1 Tax=Tilletia horrida TaxID=155126 RepID=A0AAN6GY94_9BASI|nr:Glutaredoxin [Tilletia horrida]